MRTAKEEPEHVEGRLDERKRATIAGQSGPTAGDRATTAGLLALQLAKEQCQQQGELRRKTGCGNQT